MIDINVLDKNFNIIEVIDTYESFIWTDRFKDYGDFELYSGVDSRILNSCRQDYYLQIAESQRLMIIESIDITTDAETGNHIKITGKSIESILDRRIIWDQTTVSGSKDHTLKTAIEVLFKLCFGNGSLGTRTKIKKTSTSDEYYVMRNKIPLDYYKKGVQQYQTIDTREERVITNLIYLRPDEETFLYYVETDDTKFVSGTTYYEYREALKRYVKTTDTTMISGKTYYVKADIVINKTQYTGDNFYDILQDLIESYTQYGLGYRILPLYSMRELYTDDYIRTHTDLSEIEYSYLSEYTLFFEIYTGLDRTYDQLERPYVVFSPNYDNIINTDYYDSIENYKNVSLVLGEGEGDKRVRYIVGGRDDDGNYINAFERRELYTDARDLQKDEYPGKTGKVDNYTLALKQRGLEDLYENVRQVTYDGTVEAERMFTYGKDFTLGDVIQIENEYGINGTARVIEYIISESDTGKEYYPTFDAVILVNDSVEDEEDDS